MCGGILIFAKTLKLSSGLSITQVCRQIRTEIDMILYDSLMEKVIFHLESRGTIQACKDWIDVTNERSIRRIPRIHLDFQYRGRREETGQPTCTCEHAVTIDISKEPKIVQTVGMCGSAEHDADMCEGCEYVQTYHVERVEEALESLEAVGGRRRMTEGKLLQLVEMFGIKTREP